LTIPRIEILVRASEASGRAKMMTALTVIGILAAMYFAVRWTAQIYFPPDT
jgi:hypothetical protein